MSDNESTGGSEEVNVEVVMGVSVRVDGEEGV